jgi:UDP-N-acetylmuramate--alanine ligase
MSMTHIHLVGVGGSGMSGIASILLQRGLTITGSDQKDSPTLRRLEAEGARVFVGHAAGQAAGAELVVRSSAVAEDNPEVLAARQAGATVLKRAEFLPRLVESRRVIAVAGSHGKTTTTSMIAWLLEKAGANPSYLIGSVSRDLGRSARHGESDLFVIEADEYDGMFLGLHPYIAVTTNIDHDHVDCYPTKQSYQEAFDQFARQIKPGGVLLVCLEDAGARALGRAAQERGQSMAAYGACHIAGYEGPDYCASDLHLNRSGARSFKFSAQGAGTVKVSLSVAGRHNVLNSLAALGVIHQLGLSVTAAAAALTDFSGAGLRLEEVGRAAGVILINDYAHHPTEIQATLAAARDRFPRRRIWAVWQPHTYSRTRQFLPEFAASFTAADYVLATEVYAAREAAPADGFSARQVVQAMQHPAARFTPTLQAAEDILAAEARAGDVSVTLSAGDALALNGSLLERLRRERRKRSE